MTNNILQIENLYKAFDNKIALNHISFSVAKGERVALVGASGSGKSTLMNLLIKNLEKDKGSIIIDGETIENIKDRKIFAKKIGMLRQQFDLVNNLSVIHNVLIGRLNEWGFFKSLISFIKPYDKDLAIKSLQQVGLEDKAFEATAILSGGEQQRVAIARLLLQNPLIILADEPISSLDPANSNKVLSLITNLAKTEKKTLIASMHSVEFTKQYFDRIIALKNGEIYFDKKINQVTDEMFDELYKVIKDE